VRDGVDPKVRYPEQVTGGMRLTILGAVPHVGARLVGSNDASAPAIEALRALRLRVLHAHSGDGPLMVTITSPAPGDGKSFVSVNLALSFAHAGYRTLLIDGDVRRGSQHRVLDMSWHSGLTDVLAGRTSLENAVRETSYTGLSFLGSGMRTQRAPELLLSPKLKDVMDRLGSEYQVIIVDSPPLAAGVDPVVLATATRNLVLVLRSGKTDLPLAVSKLEVLDSLHVHTIGAVLNDVRGGGAFKYYEYDPTDYDEALDTQLTTGNRPRILGEAS
jgi:tyrosine-protein kinase Etk/Wzc